MKVSLERQNVLEKISSDLSTRGVTSSTKVLILGEQQYFVWDTASQSTRY